jgi:hypothetical protein
MPVEISRKNSNFPAKPGRQFNQAKMRSPINRMGNRTTRYFFFYSFAKHNSIQGCLMRYHFALPLTKWSIYITFAWETNLVYKRNAARLRNAVTLHPKNWLAFD